MSLDRFSGGFQVVGDLRTTGCTIVPKNHRSIRAKSSIGLERSG
jgi:hypothetical protein